MKKQQLILTSCAACSGAATICPCPLQVQVMTWTTTQSFQLGGHRAHQKIWLIMGHSVKQPGDLGTGAKCQPWHGQRCCQFWCFCDFSLPYYGQAGVTLMTWPNDLTSDVTAHVSDAGHRINQPRPLNGLLSCLFSACYALPFST